MRRVEVVRGNRTYALAGALIGGGTGVVAGAVYGAARDFETRAANGGEPLLLKSSLISAVVGAAAGGIAGSFVSRPRWEWVRLDVPGGRPVGAVTIQVPLR